MDSKVPMYILPCCHSCRINGCVATKVVRATANAWFLAEDGPRTHEMMLQERGFLSNAKLFGVLCASLYMFTHFSSGVILWYYMISDNYLVQQSIWRLIFGTSSSSWYSIRLTACILGFNTGEIAMEFWYFTILFLIFVFRRQIFVSSGSSPQLLYIVHSNNPWAIFGQYWASNLETASQRRLWIEIESVTEWVETDF